MWRRSWRIVWRLYKVFNYATYISVDTIPFQSLITSKGYNDRYTQITDGLSDGTKDLNMSTATFNASLNIVNTANFTSDLIVNNMFEKYMIIFDADGV